MQLDLKVNKLQHAPETLDQYQNLQCVQKETLFKYLLFCSYRFPSLPTQQSFIRLTAA